MRFISLKIVAIMVLGFGLAACSTTNLVPNGGAVGAANAGSSTPTAETIGTGAVTIGLLAYDESGVLSDAGVDSVYRAAKLAASSLSGPQVTLHVRKYQPDNNAIKKVAREFASVGVEFIIGPADGLGAAQLASLLSSKGVPVISLSSANDIATGLYSGAFSAELEAITAVNEMARRGYKSIVVAATTDRVSQELAQQIETSAADAGIATKTVSAAVAGQTQAEVSGLLDAGFQPKAIFFATGPALAASIMQAVRTDARGKNIAVVGNSGWAMAPLDPTAFAGAWYAGIPSDVAQGFGNSYRQAYGQSPTLEGAFVYDLVVLAGALPQIVGDDPYNADVLTNAQGFAGQTGRFKFASNGAIERPYGIIPVK